jgi:hypothetical protein
MQHADVMWSMELFTHAVMAKFRVGDLYMCWQTTGIRPYQRWHWMGDEIVYDPVIPASRTIPGTKRVRYPIDIRQYLSISENAVIRGALETLRKGLSPHEQARFSTRKPGDFDLRARCVTAFISRTVAYQRSGRRFDQWRFPEETLALGRGDCEDRAFLLAALLEASGISSTCLRVAFGSLVDYSHPIGLQRWDHVWVMYQDEQGCWHILEPLALGQRGQGQRRRSGAKHVQSAGTIPDVEYIPHFVCNRAHLWRVRSSEQAATRSLHDYIQDRHFWQDFNPTFATAVHESIYDEALIGMPPDDLDMVKRWSTWADVDVLRYDPRDHFDFAYIDEGWTRLKERLKTGHLDDFAYAIHALADFYAHTIYADFADRRQDSSLELYDPDHPLPSARLTYDFGPYAPLPGCAEQPGKVEAYWQGNLISGQWWRWYTTFPDELEASPTFKHRRCLPDHDALAVDGPGRKEAHRRYDTREYREQFRLRQTAAVQHIREVYHAWRHT